MTENDMMLTCPHCGSEDIEQLDAAVESEVFCRCLECDLPFTVPINWDTA